MGGLWKEANAYMENNDINFGIDAAARSHIEWTGVEVGH